jgi:putative membrane protein
MIAGATYCGAPPIPGELLHRFNLDPVLIAALAAVAFTHIYYVRRERGAVGVAVIGWLVAAFAFLSPLCALSVSLFAARVGQHMILILIAAPMIAATLPRWRFRGAPASLWGATAAFFAFLWFWHMPVPYAWTFDSTVVYWTMHLTLFGSAIWLWAELIGHAPERAAPVLAAGTIASVQMGLLGAVITLSSWPMYAPHFTTSWAWGLTPLQDQQLGGVLMWVPGMVFFLWAALRSLGVLWRKLEAAA